MRRRDRPTKAHRMSRDNRIHCRNWRRIHRQQHADYQREYYRQHGSDPNPPPVAYRRVWTPAEDRRVLAQDIPDTELAVELDRSMKAIAIRRYRLKAQTSGVATAPHPVTPQNANPSQHRSVAGET